MKLIIFGLGRSYDNNKSKISAGDTIVAYSDNNSRLWGSKTAGIDIVCPKEIRSLSYDYVVVLTNKYYLDIKKHLSDMHIPADKIIPMRRYQNILQQGQIELYEAVDKGNHYNSNINIVSTGMEYNGGTLAAVYAALALYNKGYSVQMLAPIGNEKLINEIVQLGISVAIVPALDCPGKMELELVDDSDAVIVNVYQSIVPACEYSRTTPVLWWIHENPDIINEINRDFAEYADEENFNKISIKAVCKNVKANLNNCWTNTHVGIMPYGIPDFYHEEKQSRNRNSSLIFAVVGGIQNLKGQDIFVKASLRFIEICTCKAEFWMIGSIDEGDYYQSIVELSHGFDNIIFKGPFTRKEIEDIYPSIDVIVCPSRHEGLPIVVNEGLMNKKVCIVADTAGDNDKIIDGDNGFFFHGEDIEELAQKMKYVAEHYNELGALRDNARRTYLENYTLEAFGDRLEQAIDETIRNYTND